MPSDEPETCASCDNGTPQIGQSGYASGWILCRYLAPFQWRAPKLQCVFKPSRWHPKSTDGEKIEP